MKKPQVQKTAKTEQQKLKCRKKPGDLAGKTKKAVALVINHGLEPKEAYALVNGREPNPAAVTRLKQRVEKFSLQTPAMQKLASQAVRDVLKGKEVHYTTEKATKDGVVIVQETMIPTYTNKLAAAAMVADRVDPIVRRNENLNINADVTPVDLSRYRG